MATVDEIVEFIRSHSDFELLPWQSQMLEDVFSGNKIRLTAIGRSSGRAHADRLAKDTYRALGYEIIERPGYWAAVLPAPVAD